MTLTAAELQAMRERCEKARPGPWMTKKRGEPGDMIRQTTWVDCGEPGHNDCAVAQTSQPVAIVDLSHKRAIAEADAAFIAHSRTDIPALLDEVTKLREMLDAARIELEGVSVYGEQQTVAKKIRAYLEATR